MSASRARLANAAHAAMLQRGELRRSLGLTKSNFQSDALKDRGKFHVKSAAHDAAEFAREEVQSKRFLIGAAALGALAFAFRRPIQEKAPAAIQSASLKVKRFAASINRQLDPEADDADYEDLLTPSPRKRDKVKQQLAKLHPRHLKESNLWPAALAGGAKAKSYATDAVHHYQETLEDQMKPLNEAARDTREKAGELASRAADSARQTAEAAKARVQDGYGRARETGAELAAKGREQAHHAKEVAGHALEKGKDRAKVAGSKLKEFAEDQPLTLLVGALAAGLVVGSLIGGRNDDETK
jgi:hypothetical protein